MTTDVLFSYIRAWARHQVFIGLSSHEAAARSGLSAQQAAHLFGAVCLEIPFLSPAVRLPENVTSLVPEGCAADVLVEDESLTCRFPYRHPDHARRGEVNNGFLNPRGFAGRLLPLLDALGERVRLVVLRPAPVYRTETLQFDDMLERLGCFLAQLPGPFRYGLEPASPAFLRPEYFACLRAYGVAHVVDEGDGLLRMLPPLSEQLAAPDACAPPLCIVRSEAHAAVPGMLWPRPDPALRRQMWCEAVRYCLTAGVPLHLFIDDESDPLRSLGTLMEMLNNDLARQSILRRRAA